MSITKITEVHGIEATALLERFETLSNQITDLQKTVGTPSESTLLPRKAVAKLLGVSLVTLHEYSKKGIIPTYRIGNKVLFKQSEVFEALKLRQTPKS